MGPFFESITEYGEFDLPLRNIRATLKGTHLTLDLIPEARRRKLTRVEHDGSQAMKLVLGDLANEIVEGDRLLRLEFDGIASWFVEEEGNDFPHFSLPDWSTVPKIDGSKSNWPLLRIRNSKMRDLLPDWRYTGDGLEHFFIIGAETCMHVLAWPPTGGWLPNN